MTTAGLSIGVARGWPAGQILSVLLLVAIGPLTLAAEVVAEGKLEAIRRAVAGSGRGTTRSPSTETPPHRNGVNSGRSRDASGDWDDCPSEGEQLVGELIGSLLVPIAWEAVQAPFIVPQQLMGDHWGQTMEYRSRPYEHRYPGYLVIDPPVSIETVDPLGVDSRFWSARLQAGYGHNLDGVSSWEASFLWSSHHRLSLETGWTAFQEQRSRPGGGEDLDQLVLGDLNLMWRFAQSRKAEMFAGVGARFLHDPLATDSGWEHGVNFTYQLYAYPLRPLVVHASLDGGTVGQAELFQGRLTVGATLRRVEFFTGWNALVVGGEDLSGPVFGLRGWW